LSIISKSRQGHHSVHSVDVIFQWIGMVEYIPCYSAPAVHWDLLPVTRLASRIILIEQNIKKWTGLHSVYSVDVIFHWIGMVEYIPCYSAPFVHWDLLPVTRLASRIILIEQNIKK
jgi:hypothetical protein